MKRNEDEEVKTSQNVVFLKSIFPHLWVSLVPGEEAGGAE